MSVVQRWAKVRAIATWRRIDREGPPSLIERLALRPVKGSEVRATATWDRLQSRPYSCQRKGNVPIEGGPMGARGRGILNDRRKIKIRDYQ